MPARDPRAQWLSYAATADDHALALWDKLKTTPIDNTLPPDEQTYLKERKDEALYKAAIKLDRFYEVEIPRYSHGHGRVRE